MVRQSPLLDLAALQNLVKVDQWVLIHILKALLKQVALSACGERLLVEVALSLLVFREQFVNFVH